MKSTVYIEKKQLAACLQQAVSGTYETKKIDEKPLEGLTPPLSDLLKQLKGLGPAITKFWLRRAYSAVKEDKLPFVLFEIKKENIDTFSICRETEMIGLRVDITGWGISDFKKFLEKITDVSIQQITFCGDLAKELSTKDGPFQVFLKQLYQVELIDIDVSSSGLKLKQTADQLSYRNLLLRQLKIKPSADADTLLAKAWGVRRAAKTFNYIEESSATAWYLKQIVAEGAYHNPLFLFHESSMVNDACVTALGAPFLIDVMKNIEVGLYRRDPIAFNLNVKLTGPDLVLLAEYIESDAFVPFFNKLYLTVDSSIAGSDAFIRLLKALRHNPTLQELHLAYSKPIDEEGLADRVEKIENLSYLIILKEGQAASKKAQEKLVKKVQDHNIKKFLEVKKTPSIEKKISLDKPEMKEPVLSHNQFDKKIKLKGLIKKDQGGLRPDEVRHLVTTEIRHILIDTKETKIEVAVEAEIKETKEILSTLTHEIKTTVETTQIVDQIAEHPYEGELIDWEAFQKPPYSDIAALHGDSIELKSYYDKIRKGLFSLFKYLTPLAAREIAKALPAFTDRNKDNLGSCFIVKTSSRGEVLDYDPTFEKEFNLFTPKPLSYNEDKKPLLDVTIDLDEIKKLTKGQPIQALLCNEKMIKKLVNLKIRFGDKGIELFLEKIKECEHYRPGLSTFLVEHYLKFFTHWDHFLNDTGFFCSLELIARYDDTKIACLKHFLKETGVSKYDFNSAIAAFENFWKQFCDMCREQNVSTAELKLNWQAPVSGDPMVYMERLLTILKNSRNLREQLQHLDGLTLDYFGAYYASKYEGFKIVSECMNLSFFPQDEKDHSKSRIYRTDLDQLFEMLELKDDSYHRHSNKPKPKDFFIAVYRFLGQQTHSISLNDFLEFYKLMDEYCYINSDTKSQFFLMLLFCSHDRYTGKWFPDKTRMRIILSRLTSHRHVLAEMIRSCLALYKADVRLNDVEGEAILEQLCYMNSSGNEFEKGKNPLDKEEYILKFFEHLKLNKYATLRFLQWIRNQGHWDRIFVRSIDTANFFSADASIFARYHNELLLFSGLINCNAAATRAPISLTLIKAYLLEAATSSEFNNLDYAIQLIVRCRIVCDDDVLLSIFKKTKALKKYAPDDVNSIFKANGFDISFSIELPRSFLKDTHQVKKLVVELIMSLQKELKMESKEEPSEGQLYAMSVLSLGQMAEKMLKDEKASLVAQNILPALVGHLRDYSIQENFKVLSPGHFLNFWIEKLKFLTSFSDVTNFEKLKFIMPSIKTLADLALSIQKARFFAVQEIELTQLLKAHFHELDEKSVFALLTLLDEMHDRYNIHILTKIFQPGPSSGNQDYLILIDSVQSLNKANFASQDIIKLIDLFKEETHLHVTCQRYFKFLRECFAGPEDIVLKCLCDLGNELGVELVFKLAMTMQRMEDREAIVRLLRALHGTRPLQIKNFLQELFQGTEDAIENSLKMLARSYQSTPIATMMEQPINYVELVKKLSQTDPSKFNQLVAFFAVSSIPIYPLQDLVNDDQLPNEEFSKKLALVERDPFGTRQFNCSEVERVINQCQYLNENEIYSYTYRKKLMEAFLFVNEAGRDLALYPAKDNTNKPAKDLSNEEIKGLFKKIRKGQPAHLSPFQRGLYALALMREAMYRASGQFPYSTQMIALIDCIMVDGHVVSNIDTGQGKSLVDIMKSALLLCLGSSRVDIITSSLADAERDIQRYGKFLDLLGISRAAGPITTDSLVDKEYKRKGINFSTSSNLALFHSKAMAEGRSLLPQDAKEAKCSKVSVVINETDYVVIDDQTIHRLARPAVTFAGNNTWIYDAINDFIEEPTFKQSDYSASDDLKCLKYFLTRLAIKKGLAPKNIDKLDNDTLLKWINSALLVKYVLQENIDYVISEKPEYQEINGVPEWVYKIQLITANKKIDSGALTFGNGMQQLLCARLNKKGDRRFVITPESQTIIATNNKNLINAYQATGGVIWGSSATVGCDQEIEDQYKKYRFRFSKIAPHQPSKVLKKWHPILENEDSHFAFLKKRILAHKGNRRNVILVLLKDINTVNRFKDYIQKDPKCRKYENSIKYYLGTGDEASVLEEAKQPNMSTISTPALARNADVLYDRRHGMVVLGGYPASFREILQIAGRTGREGSPGIVEYIFNKSDLENAKNLAEFQEQTALRMKLEREKNEDFYDLTGTFLRAIDRLSETDFKKCTRNEFLNNEWPLFCEDLESRYLKKHADLIYEKDSFSKEAKASFQQLFLDHVGASIEEALALSASPKELPYLSKCPDAVKMTDCTPVSLMAYDFLPQDKKGEDTGKLDDIDKLLQETFTALKQGRPAFNQNYFKYLNASNVAVKNIREAHKISLDKFLTAEIAQATHRPFIKRWLGFQSDLNRIANDRNYILLFATFLRVQGNEAVVPIATIRNGIIALLNEYLNNAWFPVNSGRKKAVEDLITKMNNPLLTRTTLLDALSESKNTMLEADIAANQSCYRAVNFFGKSRFQNTLNTAFQLAYFTAEEDEKTKAKEGPSNMDNLISRLKDSLGNFKKAQPLLERFEKSKNIDDFKTLAHCLKQGGAVRDRSNLQVTLDSLAVAIETEAICQRPLSPYLQCK